MLPQLHYYNPGHEAYILKGTTSYTPSANVRKLLRDLALLPAWYASPGDYVFVEEMPPARFLSTFPESLRPDVTILTKDNLPKIVPTLPKMQAAPWGISPQNLALYNELKEKYHLDIDIPDWKEEYIHLTSRQSAAECLDEIKSCLPDMEFPQTPAFFSCLTDLEDHLVSNKEACIVKTPYSSSGRGLLWLDKGMPGEPDRKWIKGAIDKQGVVCVETALNKSHDFALEYYSDGEGGMTYKGISLFGTNKRGAYQGNFVQSQSLCEKELEGLIGKERFQSIKEVIQTVLRQKYGTLYKGYLGVDMLLYETDKKERLLHPCVEINMRYTMGMAAIRIFEQYIHEKANGAFNLIFERTPKELMNHYKFLKEAYPLSFKDGKLREGFLSLCPVTKETQYMAYLIIQ